MKRAELINVSRDKKKERFFSDLGILLQSGIDLKTALDLLAEEQAGRKDLDGYVTIRDAVVAGGSLSGALDAAERFSAYEIFSIQIGEESGRLNEVLKQLTHYYTKRIKQKRQLVSALSYPALVLFTSAGALYFMLNFVVPMFVEVFKRFKGDLPTLTKIIIRASELVSGFAGYFFLILAAASILLYMNRNQVWFRRATSAILLRLPFFGPLFQKIYLARFCQAAEEKSFSI